MKRTEGEHDSGKKIKRLKIATVFVAVIIVLTACIGAWQIKRADKTPKDVLENVGKIITGLAETDKGTEEQLGSSEEETLPKETETETEAPATQKETLLSDVNPLDYTKEQIVEYFNIAGNRVRTEKPGFTYIETSSVSNVYLGEKVPNGMMPAAEKILNYFFKDVEIPVEKGRASAPTGDDIMVSYFGSEQESWATKYKSEDITEAKIEKEGDYYKVSLKLTQETNPKKNGESAYGRGMLILTTDDVLNIANTKSDNIFNLKTSITTPYEDEITLKYHDGYVTALIDSEGRMVEMSSGFIVDAYGRKITLEVGGDKIKLISLTCDEAKVTIGKTYKQTNFEW